MQTTLTISGEGKSTMKKAVIFGLVFCLSFGNIQAQQAPVTFTSNTTLVIIDVTIKDAKGKIIEDLKKNDFVVTEDGKTQQVAVFDFQKLDIDVPPPPVPAAKPAAAARAATPAAAPAGKPASIGAAVVQTAQPAPAAAKAAAPVTTKPGSAQPVIKHQDQAPSLPCCSI